MFLNYYHKQFDFLSDFNVKRFNHWENFEITINGENYKLIDLLNTIDSLRISYNLKMNYHSVDSYKINNKELSITLSIGSVPFYDYTNFLLTKFNERMTLTQKVEDVEKSEVHIILSKNAQGNPIKESEIKHILISTKNDSYSSRCIIPCAEKYIKLRLNDDAYEGYVFHYRFDYSYRFDYNSNLKYPKMLSPYISVEDGNNKKELQIALNDKLYDWVYKNRYDKMTTLKEIKENYQKFVDDYKVEDLK
jgi:hypothetical protein